MIKVLILTCDRFEYTAQTVQSFIKHNDMSEFDMYYADDASKEEAKLIHRLMRTHEIKPILLNKERKGCSPTSADALKRLCAMDGVGADDMVLYLQNDFRSVRPIPMLIVDYLAKIGTMCIRLFGKYKDEEKKQLASPNHLGKKGRPPARWKGTELFGETVDFGCIHWCFHPNITSVGLLRKIIKEPKREADIMKASGELDYITARLNRNVTYHIGHDSTPGGLFGRPRKSRKAK